MCGIMGYIQKNGEASIDIIKGMMSALRHRGPDDDGYEMLEFNSSVTNCALGFVRLSIRDLSEMGHQPMWNDSHTVCVTFNGEIYNADDFREELKECGFLFRGTSDTEVLLYLYEKYGIDETLKKIDGMFAICIWDHKNNTILLARDRIGEKPLYFYENNNVFMWASEYKAFYCHPDYYPELEQNNITEYLMFRYVSDGGTLLRGVTNLKPGTYYRISKSGKKIIEYWNLSAQKKKILKQASDKEFKKWLVRAVDSRLVSDVPVGVQLSGGIDSSIVTKIASEKLKNKLNTIGVVFDSDAFNEETYMQQVAGKCNVGLQKIKLDGAEFLQNWKDTTWYFEAPMNHPGSVCLLQLNRKAKESVSVLLCGEGADETLGGYPRFARYMYYYRHPIIRKLYLWLQRNRSGDFAGAKDGDGYAESFIKETQYVSSECVKNIYPNENIKYVISKRKEIFGSETTPPLRRLLNYEINTYLQDVLMRADKVSMAASVELRVPYLMPQLLENELTLQERWFVSPAFRNMNKIMRSTKKILKGISEEYFGGEFTYRNKIGLAVDMRYYFLKEDVREYIEDTLLPGIKTRKLLNYETIADMWNNVILHDRQKTRGYNYELETMWVVLSFEMWCQMYIDQKAVN